MKLSEQVAELEDYADKLAAGLPCLPKDVDVLRESNAQLAEQNHAACELLKETWNVLSELNGMPSKRCALANKIWEFLK